MRKDLHAGWERTGARRRLALLALIIIPSIFAADIMHSLLPARSGALLNGIITALFALLFGWISVGFWSAVAGLVILLRRYDKFAVLEDGDRRVDLPDGVKTALLFPVYHEDARKVGEGIRTVLRSIDALGLRDHYDVFMLSDSTSPDAWVREEEAWYDLCRDEDAFGRVFYRRRKSNLKRKSGNIADFCRRWGANYRYMVVFDADSLMSGECLARMVRAMESHPDIGILQTPPKAINSRSLIARAQQFANHLYGPLFAAGFHYWQLGEAQYWGHNAIIRVEPFMRHCQLPTLPGSSPFGGEILSHDFVESALMRRAGYGVWLAYNLDGSYEECPPSLIDELLRDRRWCQGNLQHARLLFTRGFFPTHRALFINGIMSYGSALLWFFFLLASSAQALSEFFVLPDYFPPGPSLFPDWPKYFPTWALTLLGGTAGLLFLPKALAVILVVARGGAKAYGGVFAMTASAFGEVLVSTFLAPVRMLFHSFFVVSTVLGARVNWGAQNREDGGTTWRDAFRFHWWGSALGIIWGWLIYRVNPGFFLWLSPIVAGLALSAPLSVLTSRVSLGMGAARLGLFLTPPEVCPDEAIRALRANLERPAPYCPFAIPAEKGFVRAVVIPSVHALHTTLARNNRQMTKPKQEHLERLVAKALAGGPETLRPGEKNALLGEPEALGELHRKVWELDGEKAADWGIR